MHEVIKSLAILLSASTIIGLCFYSLGVKFFPVFVLSTVFQYIGWAFFKYWIDSRTQIQLEELVNERVKEFRYQSLDCTCPDENCNFVASVPIMVNGPNTYECPKCKKEVKVYIGNKTFLTTTPIDPDPFKEFNFVENKDYDN